MYWYNFNIGDYRSHTAHLTPTEHYIYRSLIDWYYLNERPMPANDIDHIARLLLLKTDEERQALQSVLSEFFKVKKLKQTGDTVECYHHARIDEEIKNYRFKNGGKRIYDHTGDNLGNNFGNIGNVGNLKGNDFGNDGNLKGNKKVLSQAERTKKSKAERKQMISYLKKIGIEVKANAPINDLREVYFAEFNSRNENSEIGNDGNEIGNDGNLKGNAFSHPITINQEPITINQENNNTTTAGEKIFDIRNWNAPTYDHALQLFVENDIRMQLPQDEYLSQVEKFKNYNANQVAQGKPSLADSGYRKSKFIDWFKLLAEKQSKPVHDDDLPPSFRQPTVEKPDPKKMVMLNGLWKSCLPNMTVQETYAHIAKHKDAGETEDETYDRLVAEA